MFRNSLFLLFFMLLPSVSGAAGLPYGDSWGGQRYTSTRPWFSVEGGAGVSFAELDPDLSTAATGVGPAIGLRGVYHLDHRLSFPVEFEYRSFSAGAETLMPGWQSYDFGSFLLGSGARFSPWASERFGVTVAARFGLHAGSYEAWHIAGLRYGWGGAQLYLGGGLELAYYPIQPLGIILSAAVDRLMGDPLYKVDDGVDIYHFLGGGTSGSTTLRASWNF